MSGIGIIGIGISGLHLALYLQQREVPTTLYSPRPMGDLAAGPLPNLVIRWAPTLAREEALGVRDTAAHCWTSVRLRIPAAGIEVVGALDGPAESTDFRLYLPRLLRTYVERGGILDVRPCGPAELEELAARHDLVVVAAGRDGFGGTFPVIPERSMHRTPPRYWTTGFYRGAGLPDPSDLGEMTVIPGVAEVFHFPFTSRLGTLPAIGFAAVPGGPLEHLSRYPRAADPAGFGAVIASALRDYAPHVHAHIDEHHFAAAGPDHIVQGGFVPYVRRGWIRTPRGCVVMASGDAWVLNDPVMAQGANLASRTAFALGEAIAAGGPYDENFARCTEAVMWQHAEAPCAVSNAVLGGLSDHALGVLAAAQTDPVLATRVANGYGNPDDLLALLARSPESDLTRR